MKRKVLTLLVVGTMAATVAAANDLQVNNAAAMAGSSTNCSGGPCGLQVNHDNSSVAYVQDDSPNDEMVYRATWLFNPNSISPNAGNFRQTIFTAYDQNPNPGVGVCTGAVWVEAIRCFAYFTGGIGQIANFQCFVRGNSCGERAALSPDERIQISMTDPSRVCVEWEVGPGTDGGRIAYWAGDAAQDCPSSGDAAWSERAVTNSLFTGIDFVRLGTPQTNFFGVGEDGAMYFDSFESYRTLTP